MSWKDKKEREEGPLRVSDCFSYLNKTSTDLWTAQQSWNAQMKINCFMGITHQTALICTQQTFKAGMCRFFTLYLPKTVDISGSSRLLSCPLMVSTYAELRSKALTLDRWVGRECYLRGYLDLYSDGLWIWQMYSNSSYLLLILIVPGPSKRSVPYADITMIRIRHDCETVRNCNG